MTIFGHIVPVIVGVVVFWGLLAAVGLPLTVACLPQGRRHLAPLISPITAIAGISSLSHLTFFAFLQPYRPLRTYGIFLVVSIAILATTVLRRSGLTTELRKVGRTILRGWPFLIIPLLAVCLVASFFATHGVQLLSAGEDEFGYIDTARVISQHLFTHDALDLPWPSVDHVLTEIAGHQLAYQPSSRLGAMVLLADLSGLFDIGFDQAFPLMVGVATAVGIASIGLLTLQTRTSTLALLAAQAGVATSFVIVELHFQGSLSCLTSLGFRIGGLAIILWAATLRKGWRPLLLAIVIAAGWLPVYVENFGIGLILPLTLATGSTALIAFRCGRRRSTTPLVRTLLIYVIVFAIHPDLVWATFKIYSLHARELDNQKIFIDMFTLLRTANGTLGNVLLPIVGIQSYYDESLINYNIGHSLAPFLPLAFLVLAILSSLGFALRIRRSSNAVGWASVTAALFATAAGAGLGNSLLVAIRSAQWLMPQLVLGLSLLAFASSDRLRRGQQITAVLAPTVASTAWIMLIFFNFFSVVRTVHHVLSHNQETDLAVRQFDPRQAPWTTLRSVAAEEGNGPVLISGFDNTPVPHMIAWGLDPVRHIVGESITKFWTPLNFSEVPALSSLRIGGDAPIHWMEPKALLDRFNHDPISPTRWPSTYFDLIKESRCALVPVGGTYPNEWGRRVSLFGTVTRRFRNIGDLIDRYNSSFSLQAGYVEESDDNQGPFWTALSRLVLRLDPTQAVSAVLSIKYNGNTPIISVGGAEVKGSIQADPVAGQSVWTSQIVTQSSGFIQLDTLLSTKLRHIDLYLMP